MVLYAGGEFGAFDELYQRHSARVYGFLTKRLSERRDADEIFQQVFLKMHQHRASFDPKFPVLAWIFSIARNALIDHYRKGRAIPLEDERLLPLVDKARAGEVEEGASVAWDEILQLLPPDQRRLIEQRYQEGLSFEAIAEQTGAAEQTIRKRLSRSVQTLRLRLAGGKGKR